MNKKESIKRNASKMKTVKALCETIIEAFELPRIDASVKGPEISELVNQLTPWQDISSNEMKDASDEGLSMLYEAIKVSFGLGYAVGQSLDVPEIDIKPILDYLREKKALLYLPHEKKVA